jgi:hypothetical protein
MSSGNTKEKSLAIYRDSGPCGRLNRIPGSDAEVPPVH